MMGTETLRARVGRLPPLAERAIRAALVHPSTLAVKRRLRDLRWRVRGRAIANPALHSPTRSVLFVCLGNICRSPFAAHAARGMFLRTGRNEVRCSSAGIRTNLGKQSPGEACQAAERYGVSLRAHVPTQLTSEMMQGHDVIVVMEAAHLEQLRAEYPEARDRIVLLPLFDAEPAGPYERYNIADPFGQPVAAFEACYGRIERALRRWSATLLPAQNHAHGHAKRT